MLFRQHDWDGLRDGSITVAFRRWKRPTVKAGGSLRSPAGVLSIDAVDRIGLDEISDADVRRSGHPDRASVIAALPAVGDLYRIRFHHAGEDPRPALRADADLTDADIAEIDRALGRLPWAMGVLEKIRDFPATVSTELAGALGVPRAPFKARVRRLKELGLTESLEVGYQLSPRGAAYLDTALGRGPEP